MSVQIIYDNAMRGHLVRLLSAQADAVEAGFKALEEFVRDPSSGSAGRLQAIRKRADERSRDLDRALDERAGEAPLGRGDLFAANRALGGMAACAGSLAEEMLRFKVNSDRYLREMAQAARTGCGGLASALKEAGLRPRRANGGVVEAKRSMQRVARIHGQAVKNILRHPNVVEVLRVRAVYGHFHEAAARGDAAAEAVGDLLIKSAP